MGPAATAPENAPRRLRRRLWWERALFAAVLAIAVGYYLVAIRGVGGPCLITVGGKPVVTVRNRAAAERVVARFRAGPPGVKSASFRQEVGYEPSTPEVGPVRSEAEAARLLSGRLTLVAPGAGIYADGRPVFGLPSRGEAVSALSRLLKEFSPADPDLTRAFRERVQVREEQIPVSLLLSSAEAAVRKARDMTASKGEHVVRRGETAWVIARQHGVSIRDLAYANPGVNLDRLREQDRLALPGAGPPLTVIAWKEVDESVTTGPGAGQTQRVRIVYENGRQVERTVVRRPAPSESRHSARHHRARAG